MFNIQIDQVNTKENPLSWEKFSFDDQQRLYLILRITFFVFSPRVLILHKTAGLIHTLKKVLDFCLKYNLAHFSLPFLHHIELKKYILKKYFFKNKQTNLSITLLCFESLF